MTLAGNPGDDRTVERPWNSASWFLRPSPIADQDKTQMVSETLRFMVALALEQPRGDN